MLLQIYGVYKILEESFTPRWLLCCFKTPFISVISYVAFSVSPMILFCFPTKKSNKIYAYGFKHTFDSFAQASKCIIAICSSQGWF